MSARLEASAADEPLVASAADEPLEASAAVGRLVEELEWWEGDDASDVGWWSGVASDLLRLLVVWRRGRDMLPLRSERRERSTGATRTSWLSPLQEVSVQRIVVRGCFFVLGWIKKKARALPPKRRTDDLYYYTPIPHITYSMEPSDKTRSRSVWSSSCDS